MIELKNLTKYFNEVKAVDNIDLSIEKGKITAFLGPNGAGKTTTIKMMTGLLKPTNGKVFINGKDFQSDPIEAKTNISYIPDFPFVYERLTGKEFLEFISLINLIPSSEAQARINEYLKRFNLTELQHQMIKNYSHGMRQRLVFCSALIKQPKILIIDEPMVGLDPKTSRIFKDVMIELSQSGTTVFLSTHQLFVAEELADFIAIIHKGKIKVSGSLEQLLTPEKHRNLEEYFLDLTDIE